ncbi:ATP-binding cassette domain-containing protein [Thiomicrorhabdus sp. ZW0627]|uniref:heme ABC transporter ATP-binding protein n=1 Tax=Thiomicrorhabdus sp. ZW0627 TaxID=3039774 RepID=UPI0024364AD7|nr:ATP-binding cassette domain-containing protein [Thiomicrorhabdus sp. ZW0627]MDG6773726.1 ATP-binding cassette domain-containing protein [Thiomicrorhabdus sp. ZW0627]
MNPTNSAFDSKHDIVFEGLHYETDGNTLLMGMSGRFESGRVHAILGCNGAGKTSLLRCLTKEWTPNRGQVLFKERDLEQWTYRELALQRSVLPQSQDLAFSFLVEQLVMLGFDAQGISPEECETQMQEVLEVCDILHLAKRDYLTLSGGEKKRAQLARVLAQIWPKNPESGDAFSGKWLFLDEWSDGLDLKHQVRLGRFFRQWSRQGLGVVMILHDLNQILQWSDRCLLLKAGRVFAQGDASEVMTADNIEAVLGVKINVWQPSKSDVPMLFPDLRQE